MCTNLLARQATMATPFVCADWHQDSNFKRAEHTEDRKRPLSMNWVVVINEHGDRRLRIKAVWNENVQNRWAVDFLAGALPARPLRAGGPPGDVRRCLAAWLKDHCRTQSPLHAGAQSRPENQGVSALPSRCVSRRLTWAVILACLLSCLPLFGQAQPRATVETSEKSPWSFHVQATAIPQGHGDFPSPYASSNSLSPEGEVAGSLTTTFYVGRKLWNGAEVYINPEILAGNGVSSTLGIAGFPNGEIYRVDNPSPKVSLSRLFIRQTWGLGGSRELVPSGQNQVPREVNASRITLTMGKFSLVDMFDNNGYSHDARTRFMNWALMDNGAWDFAADTRGYTYGVALEVYRGRWGWRMAEVMVPASANGMQMDTRISQARADNFEIERCHTLDGHPGVVRMMAFANHAHMGSYRETIDTPAFGMDLTKSRAYRVKYGFGINLEQEITRDLGMFFRWGWNDGHTETWAFTEIDRSGSGGVSLNGRRWRRPSDHFGLAFVANGLSKDHSEYLRLGGKGFIIGDGKLNYGKEVILESYYSVALRWGVSISPDFQYVMHPAYNRDRGPVAIYAVRFHWEK